MKIPIFLTACLFTLLSLNTAQFPIEKRLMVLKKVNSKEILINRNDLSNWCDKYYMSGLIAFESMQTVKVSKERYYLIGKEFHSNRIFAFELEKVKKQLWLSYKKEMHICQRINYFISLPIWAISCSAFYSGVYSSSSLATVSVV